MFHSYAQIQTTIDQVNLRDLLFKYYSEYHIQLEHLPTLKFIDQRGRPWNLPCLYVLLKTPRKPFLVHFRKTVMKLHWITWICFYNSPLFLLTFWMTKKIKIYFLVLTLSKNVNILEFGDCIWNHHEKYIQISTNMSDIG